MARIDINGVTVEGIRLHHDGGVRGFADSLWMADQPDAQPLRDGRVLLWNRERFVLAEPGDWIIRWPDGRLRSYSDEQLDMMRGHVNVPSVQGSVAGAGDAAREDEPR